MEHKKCVTGNYPGGPPRGKVSHVPFSVTDEEYSPVEYTAEVVRVEPVWADKESELKDIQFNKGTDVNKYTRISHMGEYPVDKATNRPINPVGRTGITGRGLLGKYGPNFAADPIVSRWKRDEKGDVVEDAKGRPVLQLVLIKRKDNGEWALPGGMVDGTEEVSLTLIREFSEEALNALEMTPEKAHEAFARVQEGFKHGIQIYCGYVDDPRNTDNAWMETTAVNFHDDDSSTFSLFKLHAGDDAGDVAWVDVRPDMNLYASHDDFVAKTYENLVGQPLHS